MGMAEPVPALAAIDWLHPHPVAVESAPEVGGMPRSSTGREAGSGTEMKDAPDEIEDPIEEDIAEIDEDLEEVEPTEAELADAVVPPEPATAEVESIQELLTKQEARAEEEEAEDEDETVLALAREEKLGEPLEARVVPIQATEFVCKRCFLVKHRSQLKDKKKMLCRDCA